MASRHVTTAVTLVVLIGILALGLVVGFRELFAPLPSEEDEPTAASSPSCDPQEVQPGERLRTRQVTVNVFNSGDRAGLAAETMERLDRRGFIVGEVGNAAGNSGVRRVQVWVVRGEETAGRLVARNFGPKVRVVRVRQSQDLADGVDVVVGNRLNRIGPAVRGIRVRADAEVCVPS